MPYGFRKVKSEWKGYLLLIHHLGAQTPLSAPQSLFKLRPEDFELKQLEKFDRTHFLIACEAVYQIAKEGKADALQLIEWDVKDYEKAGKILGSVTPLENLENMLKLTNYEHGYKTTLASGLIETVLKEGVKKRIEAILKEVLSNHHKYSPYSSGLLANILRGFDTQEKLELALDIIKDFPNAPKYALIAAFSGGIIYANSHGGRSTSRVSLPKETVVPIFQAKGLGMSGPINEENLMEIFKQP